MTFRWIWLVALATTVAGFDTLPSAGPLRSDIQQQAESQLQKPDGRFVLVDINDHVLETLRTRREPSFGKRFGDRAPPGRHTIGVGDSVVVTLWEAGSGGLFSAPMLNGISTGSRSTVVPEQQVGQDGSITIPYAGRLSVRGMSTDQVEKLINDKLTGSAIQPQALVSVAKSVSNAATVLGEVTNGARVPLSPRGDRLLDVVATAGGARSPLHETFISLTRGRQTMVMPMQALLIDPSDNVFVRPQDTITVIRKPQTFTAFGATGQNTLIPFDAVGITLEEAVAKAGGLQDTRADPRGVFLLRFEEAALAREITIPGAEMPPGRLVPVIYRLDMQRATSLFLARQFKIRDKDALYVANAQATDLYKLFTLFNTLTSPVIRGASVANSF